MTAPRTPQTVGRSPSIEIAAAAPGPPLTALDAAVFQEAVLRLREEPETVRLARRRVLLVLDGHLGHSGRGSTDLRHLPVGILAEPPLCGRCRVADPLAFRERAARVAALLVEYGLLGAADERDRAVGG